MDPYEYIWMSINLLLEEIIAQYGLSKIEHNGYIYIQKLEKECTAYHNTEKLQMTTPQET